MKSILASIAKSIHLKDDKVALHSWVADIDFNVSRDSNAQRIRIATAETRDRMKGRCR